MCIELIEKVHNGVRMQRGGTNNHVVLIRGSMRGIIATQFLALHPSEGQLLELRGQHYQCYTNHGHHEKL